MLLSRNNKILWLSGNNVKKDRSSLFYYNRERPERMAEILTVSSDRLLLHMTGTHVASICLNFHKECMGSTKRNLHWSRDFVRSITLNLTSGTYAKHSARAKQVPSYQSRPQSLTFGYIISIIVYWIAFTVRKHISYFTKITTTLSLTYFIFLRLHFVWINTRQRKEDRVVSRRSFMR